MDIRQLGYDHPDVRKLVAEVQQVYVHRYGGPDLSPVDPGEFLPPDGLFAVGYARSPHVSTQMVPVACGGWRARSATDEPNGPLADGDAEIKRMYVRPAARGTGLSRVILAHLEETARAAGRRRMVLETGHRQPEAIALYRSSGYTDIGGFGVYRGDPVSLCLAKPLLP